MGGWWLGGVVCIVIIMSNPAQLNYVEVALPAKLVFVFDSLY